ncbi:MAG TPA: site-2 protease family protein [Thermoanaerobaculaceae bacterium]|nr:site-2 protease family protein [Thermoanaerobaculaceae bacterium]
MESFLLRLPEIVIQLLAFALALSVHESAHGWMADRLGDPTARWLGRITLNPIKHIDLVGTIIFPLMLAILHAPVFGWAKPVPFVTRNLRNPKRDPGLVALAGPVSNFLSAIAVTIVMLVIKAAEPDFRVILAAAVGGGPTAISGVLPPILALLYWLAAVNLVLAVFNLVPIPPLDGSHLLAWVLPGRWSWRLAQINQYGMIILFALMWTGFFGYLISPVLRGLEWILLS